MAIDAGVVIVAWDAAEDVEKVKVIPGVGVPGVVTPGAGVLPKMHSVLYTVRTLSMRSLDDK